MFESLFMGIVEESEFNYEDKDRNKADGFTIGLVGVYG